VDDCRARHRHGEASQDYGLALPCGDGLGCIVAMFAAGMAEYNFGDSEFLMLFLTLVTLPYAALPQPERT
jgi:hypothetical protein